METTAQYLSQEKHKELEAELNNLKTVERKNIAQHLDYAKSLGDLSENAEYHEARDKQADIEDRIKQIENILKNAVIVSKPKTSKVGVGSTVTLKKNDTDDVTYDIVGSEEANMAAGKISHQSPLGLALMGHSKGEEISVDTPKGVSRYKIIEIS